MDDKIVSLSGTSYPKWVSWMGLAAGGLMLYLAWYERTYHYVIVGLGCFVAGFFRKHVYLCEEGAVRAYSRVIGKSNSEVFYWKDVKGIAFASKKGRLIMSMSRGGSAWNLHFRMDQEGDILDMIERVRPDLLTRA